MAYLGNAEQLLSIIMNGTGTSTTTDTVDAPAYIKDSAKAFAKKVKSRQSNNSFSFAFMTDAHVVDGKESAVQSAKHAGQALSVIHKQTPLDFVAHGGDYVWGNRPETREETLDSHDLYNQLIGTAVSDVPNIFVMGNHDDMPYQPTDSRLTQRETFEIIGRKNRMCNAEWVAGCNYGYVDFEDKKVRVIYVDTDDRRFLESPDGVNGETALDGQMFLNLHNVTKEQADFIANKALNFSGKENYSEWAIVVVSHVPINAGDNRWKYPSLDVSSDNIGFRSDVSCVARILAAYKQGGSCENTFSIWNSTSEKYDVVNKITYNFSNITNRVQNIIAVHGEDHKISGDMLNGDILSIGVPNVVNGREKTSGDGKVYTKFAGTATGTAFSVITVDKENEKIYADVYGAGYDQEWYYGTEQPEPTPDPEPDTPDTPEPTYTNLLDWSEVTPNTRLGGSGQLADQNGWYTTDLIPVDFEGKSTATIRIRGIDMYLATDSTSDWRRIALYNVDDNGGATHIWNNGNITPNNGFTNVVEESGKWVQWDIPKEIKGGTVTHIRLCSDVMSEDSIITINEEIE